DGDWQSYGRTAFGDRYSPLAQITPQNVDKLQPAWTYRTGDIPGPNDPIALDPDSGKEIWRFDPKLSTQNAANFKGWAHMTCRGVTYHDDAAY
ncbi:glucose dehydrogenase, partial [Pseudomonas syringae pv. actinidiae ICMP 18804]